MSKRRAKIGPSQPTPSEVDEDDSILISSDSDADVLPVFISSESSESDDELPVFHLNGHLERRKRSVKERKIEKREPTAQEATAEVDALPTTHLPTVDPLCAKQLTTPTLCGDGGVMYNVVLNQTCLKMNRNKFYNMQLVKDVYNGHYYVWFRWGRVGERGLTNLVSCADDMVKAQLLFEEKFYMKTGNKWSVWANDMKFTKQKGKYDMVKVDYSCPETRGDNIEKIVKDIANDATKSRLSPSLMELMRHISDVKAMKENVLAMKFDIKQMPLGKLTKEQIMAGYKALRKIEDCINKPSLKSQLAEACSEFYTCIPHSFSRRQRPDLISTNGHVRLKLRLLEALEDLHTSLDLFKKNALESRHPLDRFYKTLDCGLTELDCKEEDYKLIKVAILNTHGTTHIGYRLVLQNVFRIEKTSYNRSFRSVGNHRMLWHGSRSSNFAGILSNGLCIAPQDVPVNGYMFGKGVYFADCISKSANYCLKKPNEEGLLVLCEVSLGSIKEETHAISYEKLPEGVNSVMGIGKFTPDHTGWVPMSNGADIACGKLVHRPHTVTSLLYNEYIVYKTSQIKMAYLVKVKFGA